MEEWNDIEGYKGYYQVSNFGRIKSLRFNKIRNLIKTKYGYYDIGLNLNGKQIKFQVHRLVAISFIPNPENKPQVNHINGIKTDNRVENLEWATRQENIKHSYLNGFHKSIKGEKKFNSKLTEKDVVFIRENKNKFSQKELSKKYNVNQTIISRIILNRIWKHINININLKKKWLRNSLILNLNLINGKTGIFK